MRRGIMMTMLSWLAIVVVGLVVLTVLIRWAERQAAFHPSPGPTPPPQPFQRFEVTTADGVQLVGWHADVDPEQPTLIYFCGNAGNVGDRADLLSGVVGRGLGIAAFNYRGTGESAGQPSEDGVYRDAEAVYDFLVESQGADSSRIIFWGHSIGGAVASELASRRPCSGLILESTFRSAKSMARRMLPWFPAGPFMTLKLDNEAALSRLELPVLLIHGTVDPVVPVSDSKALYEKAPGQKDLWLVEGAEHNDVYLVAGESFYRRITGFCLEAAGNPAREETGPADR
jgi:fermentation-respiration switch protein FrsA (DUF1100 family)